MKMHPSDFADLQKAPRESLHRARNWSKADVWRAPWPPQSGRYVVVKDMSPRPLWFRLLIGRYFLRRERRALRALRDVAGVPRVLAQPHPDVIVMEWVEGVALLKRGAVEVDTVAIQNVERIINEVHARGITHGDLHQSNVLLIGGGEVALIDWATAGVFGARRNGFKAYTFGEWQSVDRRAVAKMKLDLAPSLLSADRNELQNPSKLYRLIKNAGRNGRRLLKTFSPKKSKNR